MNSPAATASPVSGTRFGPTSILASWRVSWDHALARYYRARPRWTLTPRLGALGVGLVWGLGLSGTALGVALYPEATHVTCDWFSCHYPLLERSTPFEVVSQFLTWVLMFVPCLIMLGAFGLAVRALVRGQRRGGPRGPLIATAWHNGVIQLLTITPLGPQGLVRVRFLARLYGLWQQRALIAMLLGVVATYFLSLHILYPIFWWLGPWRQWAVQIGLVLLWSGAVAVWGVTLAAYATLNEVTYNPKPGGLTPNWSSVSMLVLIGMVLTPIVVAIVNFQLWGALSYHDANTLAVVSAPVILILVGLVYAVINYRLAGWIFRLRLRYTTF